MQMLLFVDGMWYVQICVKKKTFYAIQSTKAASGAIFVHQMIFKARRAVSPNYLDVSFSDVVLPYILLDGGVDDSFFLTMTHSEGYAPPEYLRSSDVADSPTVQVIKCELPRSVRFGR